MDLEQIISLLSAPVSSSGRFLMCRSNNNWHVVAVYYESDTGLSILATFRIESYQEVGTTKSVIKV